MSKEIPSLSLPFALVSVQLSSAQLCHPNYFAWWRQTKRGKWRAKIKLNQCDPEAGKQAPRELLARAARFNEAETDKLSSSAQEQPQRSAAV